MGVLAILGIKTEEVVLFRVRYRQHIPPVQQEHTRERRQMGHAIHHLHFQAVPGWLQNAVHLIQERYLVQESQYVTEGLFSAISSSAAASGGDGSISYTWYKDGGGSAISGATSASYTPSSAGTYTRKAADGTCNTSPTLSSGSYVAATITAPSTQASSYISSSVTRSSASVSWTRGNGDEVIVVAKASSAPSVDPTNGTSYTANPAFGSGSALSGGFVVFKGTGTSVSLTGLSSSTTYHIAVYENETSNSCNLYNTTQLTGSFTTQDEETPSITTSGSISSFISCSGSAGTEQSFTISGSNLTANISVAAPTGYEVSKTSGSNYSSSISFTPSSGTVASSTVYVRLTSSASHGASGDVSCSSSGATTQNLSTGSGTVHSAFNSGTISSAGESICNGGSFSAISSSAAASGGDGSISYTWYKDGGGSAISGAVSATYTPSSAGTYTRKAADGTCNTSPTLSSGSYVAQEYSSFNAGAINTTGELMCNSGDPSNITSSSAASGGDGSITYQWKLDGVVLSSSNSATFDPSISNGTGSYTREAKDGTCSSFTQSTGTWTVTERTAFNSGAINTTGESICVGSDPANITSSSAASGGDGNITYQWKKGSSVLSSSNSATYDPSISDGAGDYTREAKDGTCNTSFTASTGTWTVSAVSSPVAGTISGTAYTYRTGTTSLSISGNSASGTWASSDDNIATVNSSGVVTGVADGSVNITYTVSASPCSPATATQAVNITDTWVTSITHPTGSPNRYVGDYVNYTYQFEVDQTSWNDGDVGVGTDLNSLTSWTTASWYADNGSNKRLQTQFANNSGYQFTATGTHYITGRIKKDAGDAYTYSDVTAGTWTNEVVLSSASCGYLTVLALPDPASFTSSNTNHNSTDLSWTKQAHSSGSGSGYDVLVLRKTSHLIVMTCHQMVHHIALGIL
ncbi:MAG: hypothetical protein CM15mP65_00420 [Crocinitomicaceae bacterium]|nr:MAG: hypothetical protein CM15mP65_00420 [Crocinitomicaceae bacterium]